MKCSDDPDNPNSFGECGCYTGFKLDKRKKICKGWSNTLFTFSRDEKMIKWLFSQLNRVNNVINDVVLRHAELKLLELLSTSPCVIFVTKALTILKLRSGLRSPP